MQETSPSLAALKAERDTFAALAFCWGDLVFKVGPGMEILFASGATTPLTGLSPAELQGRSLLDIVAPADTQLLSDLFDTARRRGRVDRAPLRIQGPHGRLITTTLAGYTLEPDGGTFYVALRKMSAEERLAVQGYQRDEGSGLFESGSFAEIAAHRARQASAAGERTEVSLISLPGLEDVAQRLNASRRDAMMERIAEELRAHSYGGDTAALVADGRYSLLHKAGESLEAMREAIAEITRKADPKGEGTRIESASLAVGETAQIGEQDLARGLMYTLNRFGHSQGAEFNLETLSRNMNQLVDTAIQEVNDFKRIVAGGSFHVALQPIIHARTGEIHHYEALCRFDEAEPGASPFRHLQFAEETGMIHEFDLAMVEKVLQWLWQRPVNSRKSRVAVNVSGHSVGVDSYVTGLHKLLAKNDWARGRLMFEITESSRMSDLQQANRFIQGLRKRGYEVCLDDFGAGAASFQYLSALQVDVVKLDGSAVRNARTAEKGRAFLSALTELCRRLGTQTIAEMIDDAAGLRFVRDCGVDYVQGFLFGRPSANVRDFSPLPNATLFQGKPRR